MMVELQSLTGDRIFKTSLLKNILVMFGRSIGNELSVYAIL